MTDVLVQHEIDQLLDQIDGELTTHSRVVDALLDLRLSGASNEIFVLTVDNALANIPGRTAVSNDWWMSELEKLSGLLEPTVEAAAPQVTA